MLQAETEWRLSRRKSLLNYINSIDIPGVPSDTIDNDPDEDGVEYGLIPKELGAHHVYWIARLQDVADGEILRLMGLMPPGSAKSTYTSVVFPTYVMGVRPGFDAIGVSYGADLVRKFGRRGRSMVRDKQFNRIFDAELSQDSQAADEWELTNGSTYMGGGILSGITGNRADGVIWDDLIKGREQADSETIRNKTWDAYFDDLLTRKKPGAWEVGITTRWHEDDPAGRILPENYDGQTGWVDGRDGNKWFVVCFPAECEREDEPLERQIGERLWPEWFPEDHFTPFKTSPRTWSSLYQQRPAPDEGLFFKREWINWYDELPEHVHKYGASDYAVTDKGGDFTVHGIMALDHLENMYVTDWWRKQTASNVWIEQLINLMDQHQPMGWGEEKGQILKSLDPIIKTRMNERRVYCSRTQFASAADKPTRARAFQARAAQGKFYLPRNAPWAADLVSELLTFPAGKNDDQVDVLSMFGRMLDEMIGGVVPSPPAGANKHDDYTSGGEETDEEWRTM